MVFAQQVNTGKHLPGLPRQKALMTAMICLVWGGPCPTYPLVSHLSLTIFSSPPGPEPASLSLLDLDLFADVKLIHIKELLINSVTITMKQNHYSRLTKVRLYMHFLCIHISSTDLVFSSFYCHPESKMITRHQQNNYCYQNLYFHFI